MNNIHSYKIIPVRPIISIKCTSMEGNIGESYSNRMFKEVSSSNSLPRSLSHESKEEGWFIIHNIADIRVEAKNT